MPFFINFIYFSQIIKPDDTIEMKTYIFSFVFYFLFVNYNFSQIVNIEDRRNSVLDTMGWSGFVDVRFNLIENGQTIISTRSTGRIDYIQEQHHFFSISQYNFGRVENASFVEDGFQHIRYNYHWKPRLTWEVFTQLQYNEKINLRLRGLIGTGPRFELLDRGENKMYLGTLYVFEYNEEFLETEQKVFSRENRLSAYLSYHLTPNSIMSFSGTTYFQPSTDDYRISTQQTLTIKVIKNIAFSTVFGLSYDSSPPGEVVNLIYQLTNGIRWTF